MLVGTGTSRSDDASSTTQTCVSSEDTHSGSDESEVPPTGKGCTPCKVSHNGVESDAEDPEGSEDGDADGDGSTDAEGDGSPVDPEALALSHGPTATTRPPSATAAA